LNTNKFYDGLITQADHMMAEGFLKPAYRKMLIDSTSADELLKLILESQIPPSIAALTESQT
jgi:predicted Rossmann-fold nucleotide-binding protein